MKHRQIVVSYRRRLGKVEPPCIGHVERAQRDPQLAHALLRIQLRAFEMHHPPARRIIDRDADLALETGAQREQLIVEPFLLRRTLDRQVFRRLFDPLAEVGHP